MARRYEFTEGTSKRFWEIELEGESFTARWGRIGTDGQEKAFPNLELGEQRALEGEPDDEYSRYTSVGE